MDSQQSCPEWVDFLLIRNMNELSPADRQAFIIHLTSCSQCREMRERYQHLALLLHTMPSVKPLPDSTPQRIWSRSKYSYQFIPQPLHQKGQKLVTQKERRIHQSQEKKKKFIPSFSRFTSVCIACFLILVSVLLFHRPSVTLVGNGNGSRPPIMPTIVAPEKLYTDMTGGHPALSDDLSHQSPAQWDETGSGSQDYECIFTERTYKVTVSQQGDVRECFAQSSSFQNFAIQVQMTVYSGDGGGIIFRAVGINSSLYKSYRFRVSPDGTYDLCVVCGTNLHSIIASGTAGSNIIKGLGQTNTLTVIALENTIYLYVNETFLTKLSDNHVAAGKIGLFAVDFSNATTVTFRDIKVWE